MESYSLPHYAEGTIVFDVRTRVDGTIFEAKGGKATISLKLQDDHLVYESHAARQDATLDLEDVSPLEDGTWHSVAVTVQKDGTRIFVDGYHEFCGTTPVFFSDFEGKGELSVGREAIEVRKFEVIPKILSSAQLIACAAKPEPLIQFAANHLSDYDVKQVSELAKGTIFVRFRVRGQGQGGVMLAASGNGIEQLRLSVQADGIHYETLGKYGEWRTFFAQGSWADGGWHDVAVRVGLGAVELYVDGFRELHAPGQTFFSDVSGADTIMIGQDTGGIRMLGEASVAQIYESVLGDHQIKRLSHIEDLQTTPLFDRGFHGSASYRIPSLLTLPSGTVIAGADQRVSIANDSPNDINFVIRRSLDGGNTWEDLQTLLDYPGEGADGASVIDSVLTYDEDAKRVIVLIDQYPGGVGQPNNEQGKGVDEQGNLLLFDRDKNVYLLHADGTVTTKDGKKTAYTVSESGNVTVEKGGAKQPAGNIYLKDGVDPHQNLLEARTCFLQMIYSDDEGKTWSKPKNLNGMIKEQWMAFMGTSPGTGLQLKKGKHKGRILVPTYFNGEKAMRFSAGVVYSDDHGMTWKRGKSVNDDRVFKGKTLNPRNFTDDEASLHESTLHERQDGSVAIFMRNQNPAGRVAVAVSQNGGESWGEVSFHPQLPEIFSQPNSVSLPDVAGDGKDRMVFANASELLPYRGAGVLRLSEDGGKTFVSSRTFRPFHYVYQCMTVLPDGEIGLLWENEWQGLYLTKVPVSWL
jgi:sialidase-1